jgi:hypothetical protein
MQYGRDGNAIWPGLFPRESELRHCKLSRPSVKQDAVLRVVHGQREIVMARSSAEDYRHFARDCHKMAAFATRNNRTALLEMAREWDRLADQHEDATGGVLASETSRHPAQPRGSMAAPESHGVVKGYRDQQRHPSN